MSIFDNVSLMVMTPAYGGLVYDGYVRSIMATEQQCARDQIGFHSLIMGNESFIPRGRDRCLAYFMANKFSHCIFIDADITWGPDDIGRMIAHDKDIVCGAYPKKDYPIRYVINAEDPELKDGLIEVQEAGTGFMLIKRTAIERMQKAYPDRHVDEPWFEKLDDMEPDFFQACQDNYFAFFGGDPLQGGRYLSEDYEFARKWRDIGKIYVDPLTKLDHTGTHTFHGDISQLLEKKHEPKNAATA